MKVDVGGKLLFPDVVLPSLRPHIVSWSPEDKKVNLQRHRRRVFRRHVKEKLEICGAVLLFPGEVGCRRFPAVNRWRDVTAEVNIDRQ